MPTCRSSAALLRRRASLAIIHGGQMALIRTSRAARWSGWFKDEVNTGFEEESGDASGAVAHGAAPLPAHAAPMFVQW